MTEPNKIKLTSGDEIIRITPEGFNYKGQLIEDAGECHRLLVDFLRRTVPEPEDPTDEELDELAWNWYSKTGSTWYQIEAFRAYARAVLACWGK